MYGVVPRPFGNENLHGACCGNVAHSKCHILAISTFLLAGATALAYGIFFSAHLITGVGTILTLTSLFYATLLCCTSLSFQNPSSAKKAASPQNTAAPLPDVEGEKEGDTGNAPTTRKSRVVKAKVDQDFLADLKKMNEAGICAKYGDRIVDAIAEGSFYKTFGTRWAKLAEHHAKILIALLEHSERVNEFLFYFFQHPYELELDKDEATTLNTLFAFLVDNDFNFVDFFKQYPSTEKCHGLLILAFSHGKESNNEALLPAMLASEANKKQLSEEILQAPIDIFELLSEEEIVTFYGLALIDFFALENKTANTEVPGTGKPWSQFAPYMEKIENAFRNNFYLLLESEPPLGQSELLREMDKFNSQMKK